jgi:hypothetical protein
VALFADEVALEEAAAGDEVVLGYPGEQRDTALDRDQAGVGTDAPMDVKQRTAAFPVGM